MLQHTMLFFFKTVFILWVLTVGKCGPQCVFWVPNSKLCKLPIVFFIFDFMGAH